MTATLQEMLLSPDVQPRVVADCQALVDQELASKGTRRPRSRSRTRR